MEEAKITGAGGHYKSNMGNSSRSPKPRDDRDDQIECGMTPLQHRTMERRGECDSLGVESVPSIDLRIDQEADYSDERQRVGSNEFDS